MKQVYIFKTTMRIGDLMDMYFSDKHFIRVFII